LTFQSGRIKVVLHHPMKHELKSNVAPASEASVSRLWAVWLAMMVALSAGAAPSCASADERADLARDALAEIDADNARAPELPRTTPPSLLLEVQRAEQLGREILSASQRSADDLSPTQKLAVATASAAEIDRCPGLLYRAAAIAPSASGQEIYLIGESPVGKRVVARHFRILVSADGSTIKASTPSANACVFVASPAEDSKVKYVWASHVMSCAPSEFHVYLSLIAGRPIYLTTSVGSWKIEAGRIGFISAMPRTCADRRLPEVERHWIAVPSANPYAGRYVVVFAYLDPQAGFTWLRGGEAQLDAQGDLQWAERQPAHFEARIRMQGNPFGAMLDDPTIRRLGMQTVPEGISSDEDSGADALGRRVDRARALNHIGETRLAIEMLEQAYAEAQRTSIAFELAYALNAQRRFSRAETVAAQGFKGDSGSQPLCKELGFAQLQLGRFADATKTFTACIALSTTMTDRDAGATKAEIAYNLARSYRGLDDPQSCRKWLQAAADWAPDAGQRERIRGTLNDEKSCVGR
jgi:tetratricopeptide (TPR) repeat protein